MTNSELSVVDDKELKVMQQRGMVWTLWQRDELCEVWVARSADGKRQYACVAEGPRPRMEWVVDWTEMKNKENKQLGMKFRSEQEAKSAAEILEMGYKLDPEAIMEERKKFDAMMMRGGKKWEYYGVIDNKQIWAYKPKEAKHAYVIIFDYKKPHDGWLITQRGWSKREKGSAYRTLNVRTIGSAPTLEEAQDKILRLT